MYTFCDSISCRQQLTSSIRDRVVTSILKILEEKTETEAVYRGLVGLGNLVSFSLISGRK